MIYFITFFRLSKSLFLVSYFFIIIVLNSLALTVNVNRKGFLRMISEVIRTMFNKPTTPFWTGRAMDLFFSGMILVDICNCKAKSQKVLKHRDSN